jgi:hypothetical protein
MTTNAESISRFCDEMRASPQFAEFADGFYSSLTGIDRLADDSPDHAEFLDGLKYIWENPHPLAERVCKMVEFSKLTGNPVVVVMREFTGW